jgi:hypothetical protein
MSERIDPAADRWTATTTSPRVETGTVPCIITTEGVCPNAKKTEPTRPLRYVLPGACTLASPDGFLGFQERQNSVIIASNPGSSGECRFKDYSERVSELVVLVSRYKREGVRESLKKNEL